MQQVLRARKIYTSYNINKITWREGVISLRLRRDDNIKNGPFNRVIYAVGLSRSC